MNLDGYGPSAFYFDDYYDADAWGRRLRAVDIDNLPPFNSWKDDAEYVASYESKPVYYFPRTRELKIEGTSVTVPEEFVDYIRLCEFLKSPIDGTEFDDEPIDLREFLE